MTTKSEIVRTPTRVEGGITPAGKALMDQHAAMWIERIMRTAPIEPDKIIPAVKALYAAAGLGEPRVIIVPSPLVMAVAGGIASAVLGGRATRAATRAATHDATRAATYAATNAATDAATYAATLAATNAATNAATRDGWALSISRAFGVTDETARESITTWWRASQGGNMWGQWDSYLTAFRDVLGLRLPVDDKYEAWEQAAIHGGYRYMHNGFCMVSDFPEVLKVDERNRPHCADGPSHRWRDGWELYYWHGVRVDRRVIMAPESITVAEALAEKNADIRRVMFTRIGGERLSREMPTTIIEESPDVSGHPRRLYRINGVSDTLFIDLEDNMGQVHIARAVPPEVRTCDEAVAWRRGAIDYENGEKRVNWSYAPQMEG